MLCSPNQYELGDVDVIRDRWVTAEVFIIKRQTFISAALGEGSQRGVHHLLWQLNYPNAAAERPNIRGDCRGTPGQK